MNQTALQEATELLRGPFELEEPGTPASEQDLLLLLADRIARMLAGQPDYLMSLLYRLDVLEPKINQALHPAAPEPPALGLARLVLERQQQRIETKRSIRPKPLEGLEDWTW